MTIIFERTDFSHKYCTLPSILEQTCSNLLSSISLSASVFFVWAGTPYGATQQKHVMTISREPAYLRKCFFFQGMHASQKQERHTPEQLQNLQYSPDSPRCPLHLVRYSVLTTNIFGTVLGVFPIPHVKVKSANLSAGHLHLHLHL